MRPSLPQATWMWAGPLPDGGIGLRPLTLAEFVEQFRLDQVRAAVRRCGEKKAAARELGIGYSTLKSILARGGDAA